MQLDESDGRQVYADRQMITDLYESRHQRYVVRKVSGYNINQVSRDVSYLCNR